MPSILIVEDNVSLGELYRKVMSEIGAATAFTTNCHDTLGYLEHETVPDLILLDMSLPDGTGITILKYLNDNPRFKHTQIIMITGDELYYAHARSLRVQGYFYKPVDIPQLVAHVRHLLARSSGS